jgi:hypothetical protein
MSNPVHGGSANVGPFCDADALWGMARAFVQWYQRSGPASYDPYDLWGTTYGLMARRLYYRRRALGVPLVAPLILLDTFFPQARVLVVRKQRYATADAQIALGFLNLYGIGGDARDLEEAAAISRALLQQSIPGYSGHCWGYPFDWENCHGLWKKDTPFITATPYCYETFVGLFDATGEMQYLDAAASVARFVFADLKDTATQDNASASSYSPHDATQVINASAYRAFVLFDASRRMNLESYREKAWRNLNFILQSQRADGAWLYALDHPAEAFIDHFHTCFVLKNLFKLNQHVKSEAVGQAILKGYEYYRRELFYADDSPKSFAIQPRMQIVRLDLYNVAEAVTLGVLLRDARPDAFVLAHKLARHVQERYQLRDGHFVTKVYASGLRHTFPFLRWSQAQMFYALTNLLAAVAGRDRPGVTRTG